MPRGNTSSCVDDLPDGTRAVNPKPSRILRDGGANCVLRNARRVAFRCWSPRATTLYEWADVRLTSARSACACAAGALAGCTRPGRHQAAAAPPVDEKLDVLRPAVLCRADQRFAPADADFPHV